MARCLLLQAKLPKTFWLRAIATVCYLRYRVSTNNESKSPFGKISGEKTQLEKLKKFGCTVFVRKRKLSRSTTDEKALKCKFLNYDVHSAG